MSTEQSAQSAGEAPLFSAKAARALGIELLAASASNERDFDAVFTALVRQGARALLIVSDPFFTNLRDQLVALAARYALPAGYSAHEFAAAGGLMRTTLQDPRPL